MPVADVVVVHVLVDIRRIRLGGKLRRNLWKNREDIIEFALNLETFTFLRELMKIVDIDFFKNQLKKKM